MKIEIGMGAEFDKDKKHRYALWRIWDLSKSLVMFVGLNPSTANENKNDNTITKVGKIARYNGFGGVYMMNLFPFVTPYPEQLQCDHVSNIENDEWMDKVYEKCKTVVFCWGDFREARERGKEISMLVHKPMCLAKNKNGSPKHPLYCRDETKLIPFE